MNRQADPERKWREFGQEILGGRVEERLRALVLAAHPDDETIGASAMLARLPRSCVAFLTDGAPRDVNLWSAGGGGSREQYAATRRREAIRALSEAAIPQSQIFWLGAVDQESIFAVNHLTESLRSLLRELRPDILVTHPYEGGHPDHDTAALVARNAVSLVDEVDRPLFVEMTSYHARDGRCISGEFLGATASEVVSLELSKDDRERKRRMLNSYQSQRLVLESFPVNHEPLRLARQYDFSQAPHKGKLWYECLGWAMSGTKWRKLAAAAQAQLQDQLCQ
jgi:LmbE family N-acetylglucosaminyl deacetylase